MKRFLSYFLSIIACVALSFTILFSFLQICMNDSAWFAAEYYKLDTQRQTGMSNTDINKAMKALVDYMEGRINDLEEIKVKVRGDSVRMYNRDDIKHMEDVRELFQGARTVRNISLAAIPALVLIVALSVKRDTLTVLSRSFIAAFCIVMLLLAAMLIFAAVDFDSFWTMFHEIAFDNDLWQIDPSSSYLIWICPAMLFYDIIVRFMVYSGAVLLLLLGGAIAYLAIKKRQRTTPVLIKGKDRKSDLQ